MARIRSARVHGFLVNGDRRNGTPEVKPYVYRGNKPTTPAELAADARSGRSYKSKRKPGDPIDHGTPVGYQQELRAKQEPCRACKDAHNAYTNASRKHRKAAA